jgi:hypothetical protein
MEGRSYLPPEEPETNISSLAVFSMWMGFLAWLAIPFIGGIAAIVTGHLARLEIARSAGRIEGDGFAVLGLVAGYANVLLIALAGLCIAGFFLCMAIEPYLAH